MAVIALNCFHILFWSFLVFAAGTSTSSCLVIAGSRSYDLTDLAAPIRYTSPTNRWVYAFSACGGLSPRSVGGCIVKPHTAVFQRTNSECNSLGNTTMHGVKATRTGVAFSYSSGDVCGKSGVLRSVSVSVDCSDVETPTMDSVGQKDFCSYNIRVRSRAGCATGCGRDAYGAVCGGHERGSCVGLDLNYSSCVCTEGHYGNACDNGVLQTTGTPAGTPTVMHMVSEKQVASRFRDDEFSVIVFILAVLCLRKGHALKQLCGASLWLGQSRFLPRLLVFGSAITLLFHLPFHDRPFMFIFGHRPRQRNLVLYSRDSSKRLRTSFVPKGFLISSRISFGRLSNMKLSLQDLLGLAYALNRTAVVPDFEFACGADMNENSFDALFDTKVFTTSQLLKLSAFNMQQACKENASFVAVEPSFSEPAHGENFQLLGLNLTSFHPGYLHPKAPEEDEAERHATPGIFFSGPFYDEEALRHPIFQEYFAPVMLSKNRKYLAEPLLPDKLVRRDETCLVLGQTFLSTNWARIPDSFFYVTRNLIPNAEIVDDASNFLASHDLFDCPFFSVHLRMTDFVSLKGLYSFGGKCNSDPSVLLFHLGNLLMSLPRLNSHCRQKIVLATDDYASPCAKALLASYPDTISLLGKSRFSRLSCRKSLFDQEVLGHSSFFLGDSESTFSHAIHQIRTLRFGFNTSTTIWLM